MWPMHLLKRQVRAFGTARLISNIDVDLGYVANANGNEPPEMSVLIRIGFAVFQNPRCDCSTVNKTWSFGVLVILIPDKIPCSASTQRFSAMGHCFYT